MATRSFQQIDAEIIRNLDIIQEYAALGVRFAGKPRQSGKVSCHAVGRDDRHPSAWCCTRTGRYGDSGGVAGSVGSVPQSLSLWDFAVQFGGQPDWQTARREFARKAGVKVGRVNPDKDETKWRDRLEFQSWDEPGNITLAQRWCVTKKRGITVDAIRAAGGRLAYYPCFRDEKTGELKRRVRHVQVVALPCYGERLLDADPVAYVVWDVTGADLEIYRGDDVPKDRVKMKSIGPTANTMMGLHGLTRLLDEELRQSISVAWKTAGPTDMLALFAEIAAFRPELLDSHIVVTNASGEMGNVSVSQAKLFAGLRTHIVGDTDEAGGMGALKWCHAVHGIASEIFTFNPSSHMESGKDMRDFLNGVC